MSDERFDELSKALAATTTRRQALKILAATAAGGALSLFGARGAAGAQPGRCRRVGAICRQNYECCDFYCDSSTGRCACPPGAGFHLCTKRGQRRCVFCNPSTQSFNPDTCQCECLPGTVPCGEDCCQTAEQCCSSGFYGAFCCPPGVACCPDGTHCPYYGTC
jgi:hypothetical protein